MKDKDFKQLKIVLCEHDKVWCYCLYHEDTIRPNLSISLLDKYYGRYKCWACSAEGYLSKEQMNELSLSSCIIYKPDRKNLDTRWQMFNKSCYDNLQRFPLLKLGLAKQLNVSRASLDDWLVGYDGQAFTVPMFREDSGEYLREGGFCGIQRRFPDGTKRCVAGSCLGLMYSYEHIENDCDSVFICEGFSDGISVYDLGLSSISRPHCHYIEGIGGFFTDVVECFDSLIIIPDNDVVGMEGAKKLQSILQHDYDCIIFSIDGAKDVRQLIQLKGKDYVQQELRKYI